MKVKNREDNKEYEATKLEDGSYTVDGKAYSKEEMAKVFVPIKAKVAVKPIETNFVHGQTDMGGDIGKLAGALAKCQGAFTAVKKGKEGGGGAYNYADIQAVLESAMPITSKNGIAITQMNISSISSPIVLTGVKTILIHEAGGYISSEVYMPTEKTKMNSIVQMAGVNITYLRRYGIQSALGLATTDNDGSDK